MLALTEMVQLPLNSKVNEMLSDEMLSRQGQIAATKVIGLGDEEIAEIIDGTG